MSFLLNDSQSILNSFYYWRRRTLLKKEKEVKTISFKVNSLPLNGNVSIKFYLFIKVFCSFRNR